MVGGVSSAISAAWIRREILNQYDADPTEAGLGRRIKNRTPLAIAGLGFAGLSTVSSLKFDKFELEVLADPDSPYPAHQQMNNHRTLHSIPYIGGAILSAHLLRDGASKLGSQIASKLDAPRLVEEIINGLNSVADWVINSLGTGVLGHIVGDIPTSSPLRLLAPFSDRNLAMNLITNSNPLVNKCLRATGWSLVGGSWAVASLYLLSKTPPDIRIREFAERIAGFGSVEELIKRANADLRSLFMSMGGTELEDLTKANLLRTNSGYNLTQSEELPWSDFQPDNKSIWGVDELTPTSLSDAGIITKSVSSQAIQASPHSLWDTSHEISEDTYWSEASAETFWDDSPSNSLKQKTNDRSTINVKRDEGSFYE